MQVGYVDKRKAGVNMDILYTLLMDRCNEIKTEGEIKEKTDKVHEAYKRIIDFSTAARKEGLLALELMAEELDKNDETQAFFYSQILLIVDGTDNDIVIDIGTNGLISSDFLSYDGLIALMYLRGSIMIQNGDHSQVIEMTLKSMLPQFIRNSISAEEKNRAFSFAEPESFFGLNHEASTENDTKTESKVELLCKDDGEIDETDHSIINQTAITLLYLSDQSMQRLLKEVDIIDIAFIMKALPGKVRKRIFDNLSTRLGNMIAEDMELIGTARLCDQEDTCSKVMRKLVRLVDMCEIAYDVSVLKVVLDIYDKAEKKNRELREEYRELKKIIDQIYLR